MATSVIRLAAALCLGFTLTACGHGTTAVSAPAPAVTVTATPTGPALLGLPALCTRVSQAFRDGDRSSQETFAAQGAELTGMEDVSDDEAAAALGPLAAAAGDLGLGVTPERRQTYDAALTTLRRTCSGLGGDF